MNLYVDENKNIIAKQIEQNENHNKNLVNIAAKQLQTYLTKLGIQKAT